MDNKFTVADRVVLDTLSAIGRYGTSQNDLKPVVYGGIAHQLYTAPHHPELLRPTADLDVELYPRMTIDQFKRGFGRTIADQLEQYRPRLKKNLLSYEVNLRDTESGLLFFLHAFRRDERKWEEHKRRIGRMISHAQQTEVPSLETAVYTVLPEDIISDKTNRLTQLAVEGYIPCEWRSAYHFMRMRAWELLADSDFPTWLAELVQQKSQLPQFYDRGEEEFKIALGEYRASKDLFDIALLAKLANDGKLSFDDSYYDAILRGAA